MATAGLWPPRTRATASSGHGDAKCYYFDAQFVRKSRQLQGESCLTRTADSPVAKGGATTEPGRHRVAWGGTGVGGAEELHSRPCVGSSLR